MKNKIDYFALADEPKNKINLHEKFVLNLVQELHEERGLTPDENSLLNDLVKFTMTKLPSGFETGKAALNAECEKGVVRFYINPNFDHSLI